VRITAAPMMARDDPVALQPLAEQERR